jgi:hypothetical protein
MMPQITSAFRGWLSKITITKVFQKIENDGLVSDSEQSITFEGTVQPLSPQKLMTKPEGLRSWEWLQIHCFSSSLNLATNDIIVWKCKKYKVMGKLDYSLNGYVEYHAIEDFKNA